MNYVVLDIETQDKIDFSNTNESIANLNVSIAVTYNSLTNKYSVYTNEDIYLLVDELLTTDLVIGINLLSFDYPVLEKYDENIDFGELNTLDILDELHQKLGFRVSLSKMASATLDDDKIGSGLEAVNFYKNGEFMELVDYCKQDVILTRKIYEFGKAKGYIKYQDNKRGIQKVNVDWDHE